MKYDFDSIVERKHTHSTKWLKFSDPNIIPMWIADMDFACPKEIIDPMRERVEQGIFGYTDTPDELTQILKDRIKLRSGWDIEEEWVVWVPGAVVALNLACKTALAPGEIVVTPSPIYAPFDDASENMARGMVKNFLIDNNGRMELDFDATEELLSKDTKMLFFCNPHNPGGTVFNKEEITTLVDICEKHNITICSDEIHCDLILQDDLEHFHLASLNEYAKQNSITILGPCKTFNLAGFPLAASIIPNKELREDFIRNTKGIVSHIDNLAFVASTAAYKYAGEWHKELIEYLQENKKVLIEGLNKIDGLSLSGPEAGFLAWVDCRETGLDTPGDFFINHAGVGVYDGSWFGREGYIRLNFGCPRSVLEESIERIQKAFSQRN